jgi:uncharacterized NAD-dependent epimerase/dehydratase family protein
VRSIPSSEKPPTDWSGFAVATMSLAVVDATYAGQDAGQVLDGVPADIPVVASVDEAIR